MKKLLLLSLVSLFCSIGMMSQCTPDALYADSLYGVWPDTITNFVPAIVNELYFQQLDLVVPSNASQVPGAGLPSFTIDSGAVTNVAGLPPGLVYQCNSHTSAPCTFNGGQQGCAVVTGVPTELGTYPITIDLTAFLIGFGYPLSFEGYEIVVTEGSVGLLEASMKPVLSQNVPNPFTKETIVPFQLHSSEIVEFKVMDLLGQEVHTEKMEGAYGDNTFTYRPEGLESGIYLYSIKSSAGTITRRMVYDRP